MWMADDLSTRSSSSIAALGLGNTEIARRLVLSEKTIRNNFATVLTKLQVHDRAAAVAMDRDAGLGRSLEPQFTRGRAEQPASLPFAQQHLRSRDRRRHRSHGHLELRKPPPLLLKRGSALGQALLRSRIAGMGREVGSGPDAQITG